MKTSPLKLKRQMTIIYMAETGSPDPVGALRWIAGADQLACSERAVYSWTQGQREPTSAAIRCLELLEERIGKKALAKARRMLKKWEGMTKEQRRELRKVKT